MRSIQCETYLCFHFFSDPAIPDVDVYHLDFAMLPRPERCIRWRVVAARPDEYNEAAAKKHDAVRRKGDEQDEKISVEAEDLHAQDSDKELVASGLETDVDQALDEEEEEEVHDEAADENVDRAATGTFTVRRMGYFTITHDPKHLDCTMRMLPKWESVLGEANTSRNLLKAQFGESGLEPVRTYFCLQAWVCRRANVAAFLVGHPLRKRWLDREIESLKGDIQRINAGAGTGSAAADTFIRECCPAVLPNGFVVAA